VSDTAASTAFWCDRLGFAIAYQRPKRLFVYLERPEGAQLMLCQRSGNSLNGIKLLTNYAHICYFSQSFSGTRAAEIGSSHADTLPAAGFFCQSTAGTRAYALFLQPPCRWNSRISAARPVSIADNFLLKQQKQWERRFAKRALRYSSSAPRGLCARSSWRCNLRVLAIGGTVRLPDLSGILQAECRREEVPQQRQVIDWPRGLQPDREFLLLICCRCSRLAEIDKRWLQRVGS
jgi:hypothetical protein